MVVIDKKASTKDKFTKSVRSKFIPLSISACHSPEITVPIIHRPKNEQEEDPVFLQGQQEISKLIGYFPLLENARSPAAARYMPNFERNRQLEGATTKRKNAITGKWTGDSSEYTGDEGKDLKWLLCCGRRQLHFVRPVPLVTDRGRQRALDASKPSSSTKVDTEEKHEQEEQDEEDSSKKNLKKLKLRMEMKQREEKKIESEAAKKARKRKETLQKVIEDKRRKRQIDVPSTLTDSLDCSAMTSEDNVNTDDVKPASRFAFNLNTEPVKDNVKKVKPSIASLKEELKMQLAKRKMLTNLEKEGNRDEVEKLREEVAWDNAAKKIERAPVKGGDVDHIVKQLKKVEDKKKKSGKKLKEVLERQKQNKHKKYIKRTGNLKEKKVERLAKKMTRLQKRGLYVPQFM